MKKGIMMDMDGTLFQTDVLLEPALAETFSALRTRMIWQGDTPIEKYREIMGVPLPEVWKTLLAEQSDLERELADELFQEALVRRIGEGEGRLYQGVKTALRELAEDHWRLHVISNGRRPYLEAIVDAHGLRPYLAGVHSIDDLPEGNKTALCGHVLEKEPLEKAVMIGDRASDGEAGRAYQLPFIGCTFGFALEEELAAADARMNEWKEVQKHLDQVC
ncbi:HAD family hydrolase [Alkalicoccus urumqiensis]|uniref:Nucleosidase n=1 Tax=Alkalicoccus urumqiensis TaxID=1548213 RepID=A0A2P6ME33_ALKUR|nr:HAD family hydrolase [Alkalicoccus urumqiensis]PRO64530.1 nucleosidase [Alkalicoccus urumqiensis]